MTATDEITGAFRSGQSGETAPASRAIAKFRDRDAKARNGRIALFGLFGCGNFGNDASLEAMLETLRATRPRAEFACICHDTGIVAGRFGIVALPISWSRTLGGLGRRLDRLLLRIPGKLLDAVHAARQIRSFDVMMVPGTGILDDFGDRPWGMPLNLFLWCLAARLCGVKIAFVSVGAGPIHHRASRWLMLTAARLAHYRSYRDQISKDFMTGLGLNTRGDAVYPDVVFKLPVPVRSRIRDCRRAGPVVGVGVMNYRGWYGFAAGGERIYASYIGKLSQFVHHLLDRGCSVRLLTGELGDHEAINDLIDAMKRAGLLMQDDHRLLIERSQSLHDLLDLMSETDFVVATRFHNIVCALKLGKPTISLGYARKNEVLMAQTGLGAFCQHVELFETKTLIDQFNELVAQRAALERRIAEHTASFGKSLELQTQNLLVGLSL